MILFTAWYPRGGGPPTCCNKSWKLIRFLGNLLVVEMRFLVPVSEELCRSPCVYMLKNGSCPSGFQCSFCPSEPHRAGHRHVGSLIRLYYSNTIIPLMNLLNSPFRIRWTPMSHHLSLYSWVFCGLKICLKKPLVSFISYGLKRRFRGEVPQPTRFVDGFAEFVSFRRPLRTFKEEKAG